MFTSQNPEIDSIKLSKFLVDYKLGYIWGKIKTHEPGNPHNPTISQIDTPACYIKNY